MTVRMLATTLIIAAALSAPTIAQNGSTRNQTPARAQTTPRAPTPPPPPAAPGEPAPPPPPPAPPRRVGQPVNIKIDVTITDQRGANAPALKKTVSIVTADGLNGRIRSTANYSNLPPVPLNVDAEPEILADGKIRVRVNLQYNLPGNTGATQSPEIPVAGNLRTTDIGENLSLILENGKSIVAAQSADPVGDRQVIIELKAAILK